eukprot:8889567-Karenia_brevis.AAC.1
MNAFSGAPTGAALDAAELTEDDADAAKAPDGLQLLAAAWVGRSRRCGGAAVCASSRALGNYRRLCQ